jgi:translation initiation factor IF-2
MAGGANPGLRHVWSCMATTGAATLGSQPAPDPQTRADTPNPDEPKGPDSARPWTSPRPSRLVPAPVSSRSQLPACAPTSPSLDTRSTGYEQISTNSGDDCGCNSVPRSNNPTGPNSSHGSPRWKLRTANSSPNATQAPPRPTPPNAASNNSKTNSPPPEKASDESSGTPTDNAQAGQPRSDGPAGPGSSDADPTAGPGRQRRPGRAVRVGPLQHQPAAPTAAGGCDRQCRPA